MTAQELSGVRINNASTRALLPPLVPGAIANKGLRWDDLHDPESPVLVQVVFSPGSLSLNDRLDLYWQKQYVTFEVVNKDHLAAGIVNLWVPPQDILLHPDGVHILHYIATSAIGGDTNPSPDGQVKVKRLIPGGYDSDAGTEYINENLAAPTGIPELIDDDIAEQGITVTVAVYENMAEGDSLQLDWGGQRLSHAPLTLPEVNQPVTFRVEKETLVAAPGTVTVRYDIRDEVNNWSKWSLSALTDVEAGENLLGAPRIMSASKGIIDLAVLGDQDAHVQTPVYTGMGVDDRVVLTWQGETVEGAAVPVIQEQDVEDNQWPLDFYIPNDKVRAIAQGHTVVTYKVTPAGGGLPIGSRRARADVVGEQALMPAPQVQGVVGDVLDPYTLPPTGATVTILANDLIKAGNTIALLWDGLTADNSRLPYPDTFPVTGLMEGGPIDRIIPLAYITPLLNGSVTVKFTLIKDGAELDSLPLVLQVRSLGVQLPKPTIDFSVGDTLNPDDVPANGTTVRVNYNPMEIGDRIDVHWDGVLDFTDYFPVPIGWNNKEVPFAITKNYVELNREQTVQVFYTVTRAGQVLPDSLKQALLIGSALDLIEPSVKEAVGNSLDPVAAKDTLTVVVPHYTGMLASDELTVTWAGKSGEGSYTSPTPIPVGTVGEKEIEIQNSVVAFNLGKPVTVTYSVIRAGSEPKPSQPFLLAVQTIADNDADLDGLAKISQADESDVLDLKTFSGNATVRVNEWPFMTQGQKVWLRIRGTLANGNTDTIILWENATVTPGEADDGYLSKGIPRARLELLKDSSNLTVEFKVNFNKQSNEAQAISFPVPIYTLKQVVELDLKKPSVKEADDNSLDPIAAKDHLTVVVPHYTGMNGSDYLTVTWAGTAGEGSYTSPTPIPVGTVGEKEITISNSVVAFNLGKSVTVSYSVIRGSDEPTPSEDFVLAVQAIADNDVDLAGLAKITPVVEGVLDLNTFTGDATFHCDKWPFMAKGQKVWLRVHGTLANGNTDTIILWENDTVTTGEVENGYLSKNIPRARLELLKDSSNLTVEFKVNFSKQNNETQAVKFPTLQHTIIAKRRNARIEDFNGTPEQTIPVNVPFVREHMTITSTLNDTRIAMREAFGGACYGNVLGTYWFRFLIEFKELANTISFNIYHEELFSGVVLKIFDANGLQIGSDQLIPKYEHMPYIVSNPDGVPVKSMTLHNPTELSLHVFIDKIALDAE